MQLQQMQLQIQQSLTTEIMQIERGERERREAEATVKRTICAQRAQGEPELESDPTD